MIYLERLKSRKEYIGRNFKSFSNQFLNHILLDQEAYPEVRKPKRNGLSCSVKVTQCRARDGEAYLRTRRKGFVDEGADAVADLGETLVAGGE